MGTFRLTRSSVPVQSAITEVAPSTLLGMFDIPLGVLGEPAGTRHFIRANYSGPMGVPDLGVDAEWMLYTRSVMSADIRYDGNAGASLVVQTGSVEIGGVPSMIDWTPFYIPPDNYPFNISGLELPAVVVRFYIVFEAGNVNDRISGSIIVRAL